MESTIEELPTNDPSLVGRYLADQLSEEDRAIFEERLVNDPAVLKEVELTARFKAGLAQLRDSGELAELFAPQRSRMPYWAAAAAVAVLAVGITIWNWSGGESWGAPSLQALIEQRQSALPLGQRYTLLRLRSAERVDVIIELPPSPQALELRVLPDSGEVTSRYRVTVSRVSSSGARDSPVVTVEDLSPDQQGFITLFVDSAGMLPGQYQLAAEEVSSGPATATTTFLIEARPRSAGQ